MKEDLTKNRLGAKADLDFHTTILRATRNQAYIHTMQTIYDILQEGLRIAWGGVFRKKEKRNKLFQQHQNIFKTIKARDPKKGAEETLKHLTFVEENWREALEL